MPARSDTPARAAARAHFARLADELESATPGAVDPENPHLTDADLEQLRPAEEVHPALVVAKRKGGRPRLAAPKVAVSIRLDADVVDALRAGGEGWQSRVNNLLRRDLGI